MTQGFLALGSCLVRSLSLVFALAAGYSSSDGSRRITARRVLSGDQCESSTSCGVSARCWASPPERLRSQICVLPSLRAERNEYLPSGTPARVRERRHLRRSGDGVGTCCGGGDGPDALFGLVFFQEQGFYGVATDCASGLSWGSETSLDLEEVIDRDGAGLGRSFLRWAAKVRLTRELRWPGEDRVSFCESS